MVDQAQKARVYQRLIDVCGMKPIDAAKTVDMYEAQLDMLEHTINRESTKHQPESNQCATALSAEGQPISNRGCEDVEKKEKAIRLIDSLWVSTNAHIDEKTHIRQARLDCFAKWRKTGNQFWRDRYEDYTKQLKEMGDV